MIAKSNRKRNTNKLLLDVQYVDTVLQEELIDDSGERQPFLFLTGMIADVYNLNKRKYPIEEVEQALIPFVEDVKKGLGTALMLADHPIQGTPPSIKDAAGLIKEAWFDADTKSIKAKVQILDNDQGKNIYAIAKAGGKVGVSSRAFGNLVEILIDGEVYHEVRDLKLKGFDFVVFPSLGEDATSYELVFENLKEEIHKIFPNIDTDLKDVKESLMVIQERLDSENLDLIKSQILEKLINNCGCKTETVDSNVFINNSNFDDIQKEESKVMKTVLEFKEGNPDLYKEIVDTVTKEVTEQVTKEVTEKVTAEVTEQVTKDVTDKVTKEVTEAVATEVKEALLKEMEADTEKKVGEIQTSLDEATAKLGEFETKIESLQAESQPYIDIVEGFVTFMRDKKILIAENEILKPITEKEEVVDETAKQLTSEMTAVINEQKAKLDEALVRIEALEAEKAKLSEEKAIAESEKVKAEVASAINEVLSKEQKYATILKSKLEIATSVDDVKKIYEAEKVFIDSIEKANRGEAVPAGVATVVEAEVISDTILESDASPEKQIENLKDYQRKLAGIFKE